MAGWHAATSTFRFEPLLIASDIKTQRSVLVVEVLEIRGEDKTIILLVYMICMYYISMTQQDDLQRNTRTDLCNIHIYACCIIQIICVCVEARGAPLIEEPAVLRT